MNQNTDYQQIMDSLRAIKPELMRRFPVRRMALFGSWARRDAGEESDVDILVDVDGTIGLAFVDMAEYLESALRRPVDLVSRRSIKPRVWKLIEPELIDV